MSEIKIDLKSFLNSCKEALEFWRKNFQEAKTFSSEIKPAKTENPLEELVKLAKLIKAHTTKVGIVFKPETLLKEQGPALSCSQKLSESIVFLISIILQLDPNDTSKIFYDEIVEYARLLLDCYGSLVDELILLEQGKIESNPEQDTESDIRLISVGRIWSQCDALITLVEKGKLGLLSKKIKQSVSLIDDGLEEFEEWTENPGNFDDDDPFGFSDEEDEDEDEDSVPPVENNKTKSDSEDSVSDEVIEFSKLWLSKIKLIKLLLNSLTKSLPSVTSGEDINSIYSAQRAIVTLIDGLIVDLMLDGIVDDEIKAYTTNISKNCYKLISIVKSANKLNENKVKWCVAWDAKFKEGL